MVCNRLSRVPCRLLDASRQTWLVEVWVDSGTRDSERLGENGDKQVQCRQGGVLWVTILGCYRLPSGVVWVTPRQDVVIDEKVGQLDSLVDQAYMVRGDDT